MDGANEKSELALASAKLSDAATTAAKVVADAADEAANVARRAVQAAQEASQQNEREYVKILSEALRQVFGENSDSGRFIDVKRIPLICKSIVDMHENLEKIMNKLDDQYVNQDQFWPVKTIVYSGAGIILAAVFSALVYLVIKT